MNCPHCSAPIQEPGAIFCNNCGSNISQPSTAAPQNNPTPGYQPLNNQPQFPVQSQGGQPKKKSNNTLIICICAVIVIAILCGTAIGITVITRNNMQTTAEPTTQATVQTTESRPETQPPTTTKAQPTTQRTTEAVVYTDEYLFPTHNTYLTFEILSHYTSDEIDLICNEMYARHGQIFKKEKNQRYFSAQSWYHGKYTSMEYVVTLFNKYEKANLQTIADYRRHMGWS